MIIRLGVVAGEMLTILEQTGGPMNIDELGKKLDHPQEIVLMSLGWMVRQGYLKLEERENNYVVSLVPNVSPAI